MAFDAGMLSCVLHEVGGELTDGKIEKIYMPQKDMAVLLSKFRLMLMVYLTL